MRVPGHEHLALVAALQEGRYHRGVGSQRAVALGQVKGRASGRNEPGERLVLREVEQDNGRSVFLRARDELDRRAVSAEGDRTQRGGGECGHRPGREVPEPAAQRFIRARLEGAFGVGDRADQEPSAVAVEGERGGAKVLELLDDAGIVPGQAAGGLELEHVVGANRGGLADKAPRLGRPAVPVRREP